VPWLLDELALMTVKIRIPADDVALIAAAERAGMRQAVRLREAIARPQGRVDLLMFERVNAQWGRRLKDVERG
jgi:RimJ/RimL family protein N-acetyltransferase